MVEKSYSISLGCTVDLWQKSQAILNLSAFICVNLPKICGFCVDKKLMQKV